MRATLVYDGDCAFCTRCVGLVESLRLGGGARLVASQHTDLPALGLTPAQVEKALQWVAADGSVSSGHAAVARLLLASAWFWRPPGAVLLVPPVSWVAARAYRWVAEHRDLMPGGTAACALPPDQRPGARST